MPPHVHQDGYYQTLPKIPNVKDLKKLEPLCTVGNKRWYSLYGKQYGDSSKN